MGWMFDRLSVLKIVQNSPEAHTVSYSIDNGVKWLGYEVECSFPSSAEVKNDCSYTYTPLYVFTAWKENFTFFIW
jgi:Zn-finger protein